MKKRKKKKKTMEITIQPESVPFHSEKPFQSNSIQPPFRQKAKRETGEIESKREKKLIEKTLSSQHFPSIKTKHKRPAVP